MTPQELNLAGTGTQTAGVALGGFIEVLLQQQQKNIMELLGLLGSLTTARMYYRSRNSNSSISIWW
jgi:hypothetical protein